jgi:hypothetical protein
MLLVAEAGLTIGARRRLALPVNRITSNALASVEPVYVVVKTRSGRPLEQWARSASRNGVMPLRRIKAMTTSMRSADWISVRS